MPGPARERKWLLRRRSKPQGLVSCASIDGVGELIFEVVLGIASAVAGFAIGSIVFALVRVGRRALLGSERATQVTDREGLTWTVRIPLTPYPMRFWASQRMFRMRPIDQRRRQTKGVAPDGVDSSELAHPSRLVERTDEVASIAAVVLLGLALIALSVLFLEFILAVVVAVVVAVIRLVFGRWQCELIAPDGRLERVRVGSLQDARTRRAQIAASVESGVGLNQIAT